MNRAQLLPVLLLLLLTFGCSTAPRPKNYAVIGQSLSDSAYSDLIDTSTKKDKQYKGFNNIFEYHVTLVKSDIASALLQRKSETLLWDHNEAQRQREKQFQELSSSTRIVVSFFTPETKYNDLSKPNSIWKVYLEIDGERYLGKAKKTNLKIVDAQRLYPYHNRWSELYEVSFSVPTTSIDARSAKVIFTSSLGSSEVTFNN